MEALSGTSAKLVDSRDLLDILRQQTLTGPFILAPFSERHGRKGLIEAIHAVCSPLNGAIHCTPECHQVWEQNISRAFLTNQPIVHTCAQGLLCLTILLSKSKDLPEYLIGGGVYERNAMIRNSVEEIKRAAIKAPTLESGQQPQLVSMSEAQSIAEGIATALPRLVDRHVHSLSLARTTQRLEAVQKLVRELAGCVDKEQAVAIVSEALVVLFDLPKVLIVLQQPGHTLTIHATLGLDPDTFQLDQKCLADYFAKGCGHPENLPGETLEAFFPGLEARSGYLFRLGGNDCQIGTIAILDVDLHSRDQALIDLLINRLGTQLESLKTAEGHRLERQVSSRLVAMISSLALIESRREVYLQILEMSAELLAATSGSLMLLNEVEGTLKIVAAKGMTSTLAKTMSIGFGEGIAGRVAKSRFPMLVNDIERDKRVAIKNRPRFKTKSFLSLPLVVEERLLGVLNLADKNNSSSFSEADLNLVQTFTKHALLMVERAATLEMASQLEQLAITDPLTGLYNRRFLADRLQEEFSRSKRQQQSFCIIMADLDNFKLYNDICGHLAGDNALRKTAELMQRSARDMDVVTRFGGEEFCLILPGTGKKESVFVGERIRRAIEVENFPGENHLPLGRLTISLGVATFPADGVTANELIHAADQALYQAKGLGRNCLVLYEASLENHALLSHHE
jgi:diguanylate cyclase (GGDEF)-like protein